MFFFFLIVKPYIPYDIIPFDKPLPMLSWAHYGKPAATLKCPSWVSEADIVFRPVEFSTDADAAIEIAFLSRADSSSNKGCYYATDCSSDVKVLIIQVFLN